MGIEAGLHYYEEKYKERLLKGLQKRAADLGYELASLSASLTDPLKRELMDA
jgi:hypothetical protein